MKNLIVFLILSAAFILSLQSTGIMKKTRNGEYYESFGTVDAKSIPVMLAGYLREQGVKYYLYKTPNYVDDFFTSNIDFSLVKRYKPKYTVISFVPQNESEIDNYKEFKERLDYLYDMYKDNFNRIERSAGEKVKYPFPYENDAYKNLEKHCRVFCIVDPSRGTIFVFKRISTPETEALDAVFQHYDRMLK